MNRMDAVDLDPLPVVWERWSVLAAVDAAQTPLVLHDLLTQDLEYDPADDAENDAIHAAVGRLGIAAAP
jgi:hypothetical protein